MRCSCQWFWSAQTLQSHSPPWWVFSHSHQWFWSAQTPESHSPPGCMFSYTGKCSKIGEQLTIWMHSAFLISSSDLLKDWRSTHPLDTSSAILIYSNNGEQLTSYIQPFLSLNLICSKTGELLTCWMCVQPFLSVVPICSDAREQLTRWMHVQHFISGSDPFKYWRATHPLNACSAILLCPKTGE